ncbi:hypothetical protein PMO01_13890 [Pseudomonas moraviensis R28-S]|jgi:hypothetical protein|uniref:Uncharacterized protein n=1 Tax=Pseudomonas moraviensis R28-S TaxID=1395516 RepID=V8R8C3_9PSED|nr:hypothetical protein PMO01_13890 [Pseudomonas moraviensis R28-S]
MTEDNTVGSLSLWERAGVRETGDTAGSEALHRDVNEQDLARVDEAFVVAQQPSP